MKQILLGWNSASERCLNATKKHNGACRQGCHECCATRFFDSTLLDALYLHKAMRHVAAPLPAIDTIIPDAVALDPKKRL